MDRGQSKTPSRRALLAAGGVAVASLAGCTGSDDTEGEETGQVSAVSNSPEDGVVLDELSIVNFDQEERSFDLLVEHDEETVHWDSHDADAQGDDHARVTIDAELPRQAGEIVVRARVDEQQATAELTDIEGVCVALQVVFAPNDRGESLDIYRSERECPDRFAGG